MTKLQKINQFISIFCLILGITALFLLPLRYFLFLALYIYTILILWEIFWTGISLLDLSVFLIYLSLSILYYILKYENILPYTGSVFYGTLGIVSLISLILKKPFTSSFFKGEVNEEGYKIHTIITTWLAFIFLVSFFLSVILFPKGSYIWLPLVIVGLGSIASPFVVKLITTRKKSSKKSRDDRGMGKPLKFFFLILLAIILTYRGFSDTLTISKIKVFGNTYTREEVILAFLKGIKEGQSIEEEELKNRLSFYEALLKRTGWFYNVNVFYVPSVKGEGKVNVIVEVEEGFLYRFWGGPIFAGFGIDNFKGQGSFLGVELGINRQKIYYYNDFLGLSRPSLHHYNFFLDLDMGMEEDKVYNEVGEKRVIHRLSSNVWAGVWLPFTTKIGLLIYPSVIFDEKYKYEGYYITSGINVSIDNGNDTFSPSRGNFVNLFAGYIYPYNVVRGIMDVRWYFGIYSDILKLASMGKIGAQTFTTNNLLLFNLYTQEGVRRTFSSSMLGNYFYLLKNEVRLKVWEGILFNFVWLSLEPAVFVDIGRAFERLETVRAEDLYPLVGYGGSLRIYLGMPVFLPINLDISFSGGIDVFFSVEKPF